MGTIRSCLPLLVAAGLGMEPAPTRFVVHEWGTFTSVVGEDGVPIAWHPLEQPRDLPGFVYVGTPKGRLAATIRMETPVLYFYSDHDVDASVRVDFPGGQITEWYPVARWEARRPSRLEWTSVRVRPGAAGRLRRQMEDARYYRARQTDSTPVSVGGAEAAQEEKFLFYRGVGTRALPVSVRLLGDAVEVRSAAEVGPLTLFERRGGRAGYRIQELAGGEAVVDRPVLGDSLSGLRGDLQRALVERGLYPREAAAMVATWDDSWFEEGLRLFYILPPEATDLLLPLSIDPEPQDRARVLMARIEILTPEMEREAEEQIATSRTPIFGGRFTEALLRRVQDRTEDPRVRARIGRLLDRSRAR